MGTGTCARSCMNSVSFIKPDSEMSSAGWLRTAALWAVVVTSAEDGVGNCESLSSKLTGLNMMMLWLLLWRNLITGEILRCCCLISR